MEGLLTRGDSGLGILIMGVRTSVETHRCPGFAHWGVVGLGEMGDAGAMAELATLMRLAVRAPAIDVGFSAAEAVGKMGPAAEEDFLRFATATPSHERYWFHYAAACLGTQGAADFVMTELGRNRPLADSAALALATLGRTDALPAIDRALRRARAWQVPMLVAAVTALHRTESPIGTFTEDWRLRYRYQPEYGRFPPLLPCLTAMMRGHRRGRRVAAAMEPDLPRSVDAIIQRDQRPREAEARPCPVCGAAGSRDRTGVTICDDCAPATARVQADCLLAVDSRSNDLFEVLNTIENQLMDHDVRGLPATDQYRRQLFARSACYWLIGQRVDSVAAGAAMLLAEADALACSSAWTDAEPG